MDAALERALLGERAFGHAAFGRVEGGEGIETWEGGRKSLLDHAWYLSVMRLAIRERDPAALHAALGDHPWYALLSRMILPTLSVVTRRAAEHRSEIGRLLSDCE